MTNFKQCNRCATDCEHRGAIRVCVCGKYTELTQTNGDRIRAMNDEELAEFLSTVKCRGAAAEACDAFWEDTSYDVDWLKSAIRSD